MREPPGLWLKLTRIRILILILVLPSITGSYAIVNVLKISWKLYNNQILLSSILLRDIICHIHIISGNPFLTHPMKLTKLQLNNESLRLSTKVHLTLRLLVYCQRHMCSILCNKLPYNSVCQKPMYIINNIAKKLISIKIRCF